MSRICTICNKEHSRRSNICQPCYLRDRYAKIKNGTWHPNILPVAIGTCKVCNEYKELPTNQRTTCNTCYLKQYRQNNHETLNIKQRKHYRDNYEKIAAKQHRHYEKHKREIILKNTAYQIRRDKYDINWKLARRLRSRTEIAIRSGQKNGSAVSDLGCTIPELKKYLESQFLPGMTWDNWCHTGWHIDHIIPLSEFDLTDREQFLKACHYTNLQPMWATENIRKGNRIE